MSEPTENASGHPGRRERKRLRRRLAARRAEREELLLDLGGLVYEMHRQRRRAPALLQAKAAEVSGVDDEVRALAELVEPAGLPQPADERDTDEIAALDEPDGAHAEPEPAGVEPDPVKPDGANVESEPAEPAGQSADARPPAARQPSAEPQSPPAQAPPPVAGPPSDGGAPPQRVVVRRRRQGRLERFLRGAGRSDRER